MTGWFDHTLVWGKVVDAPQPDDWRRWSGAHNGLPIAEQVNSAFRPRLKAIVAKFPDLSIVCDHSRCTPRPDGRFQLLRKMWIKL